MAKQPCVYIMTNKPCGTLYVGVTSDPLKRIWQHKQHAVPGFTSRYGLTRLVYVEACETMYSAITREKAIKNWRRKWKIELIERANPKWEDLYSRLV